MPAARPSRSTNGKSSGQQKDRLVVMVRDPYWLHAHWEITRQSVERAQAALGTSSIMAAVATSVRW